MKIKTFRCESIQAAIQTVRNTLGPSASVIHVRSLAGGDRSSRIQFEVDATNDIDVPSRFATSSTPTPNFRSTPNARSSHEQPIGLSPPTSEELFEEQILQAQWISLLGVSDHWTLVAAQALGTYLRSLDSAFKHSPTPALGYVLADPALASSAIELFQHADQYEHPLAVVSNLSQLEDAIDRLGCQRVLVVHSERQANATTLATASSASNEAAARQELRLAVGSTSSAPFTAMRDLCSLWDPDCVLAFTSATRIESADNEVADSDDLIPLPDLGLPMVSLAESNGDYQIAISHRSS